MSNRLKAEIGAVIALLLLAYGSFLYGQWKDKNQGAVLPSALVAEHNITIKVPVKGKDKDALVKKGQLAKPVAQNPTKEVTATGTKKDETGTTHMAAVLDTGSGESIIIQQRPKVEFLEANKIGIGMGVGTHGLTKTVYYDRTWGRVFNGYFITGGEYFFFTSGNEWMLQTKIEWRF